MPRYKRQSYQNITRSYLEFVRLREHLVAEHPEALVPVLPPERSLVSASDVQSMRLFLERISRHRVLSQDIELQMFIESEFGVGLFLLDICMIFPVCISLTHFTDHLFFFLVLHK